MRDAGGNLPEAVVAGPVPAHVAGAAARFARRGGNSLACGELIEYVTMTKENSSWPNRTRAIWVLSSAPSSSCWPSSIGSCPRAPRRTRPLSPRPRPLQPHLHRPIRPQVPSASSPLLRLKRHLLKRHLLTQPPLTQHLLTQHLLTQHRLTQHRLMLPLLTQHLPHLPHRPRTKTADAPAFAGCGWTKDRGAIRPSGVGLAGGAR